MRGLAHEIKRQQTLSEEVQLMIKAYEAAYAEEDAEHCHWSIAPTPTEAVIARFEELCGEQESVILGPWYRRQSLNEAIEDRPPFELEDCRWGFDWIRGFFITVADVFPSNQNPRDDVK